MILKFLSIPKIMKRQRGNKATRQQGNENTRQRGKEATRQRGNKAKRQQGKEATRQRGNKAKRQQGNENTRISPSPPLAVSLGKARRGK
jgi:chromatin remodeling complex protein RSC6